MTKCEFFTQDDRITGFSVSGHSGYAEAGSDIVCAAVSAVVSMAEATINDVCGAKAKVRDKKEQARVTLTLPAVCDEDQKRAGSCDSDPPRSLRRGGRRAGSSCRHDADSVLHAG